MALPDEENLLSKNDETVDDVVDIPLGEVIDRVDAGAVFIKEEEVVDESGGAISNIVSSAVSDVGDTLDDGDDSILKWLIPLLLIVLLVILGFWFCSKTTPVTPNTTAPNTNLNANTNSQ